MSSNRSASWFDEGHLICFFTARTSEHKSVTEEWLKRNDVKYHQIIYGKPRRNSDHVEYHFIDKRHGKSDNIYGPSRGIRDQNQTDSGLS